MKIVNPNSLAATLDAVSEAFFYGRSLLRSQRMHAAKWIASRQGMPGSYANMFSPTNYDFKKGIRLFTGELVHSHAAVGHIIGEEASRALILLDVSNKNIQDALARAKTGMMHAVKRHETIGYSIGMYCCGTCTVAFWRNLLAGGLVNAERRLAAGMKALKSHRDGYGKWRQFPFYYTLLALSEIDLPSANEEMRYASKICEQYLGRAPKRNKIALRRRILVERILAKC